MKRVFFTAGALIFLGIAWTLFLRWDRIRFVESLPKAPVRTDIQHATEQTPQDLIAEDKSSDALRVQRTQDESAHIDEETPIDTTDRPLHHNETHSYRPELTFRHESEQGIETLKPENKSPIFAPDLSAEELIEMDRQSFVEKYGNIPEIDIFFKYMSPVYEAWAAGESQFTVDRTNEKILELSRAQMVLYPDKPYFRKEYERALKILKEQEQQ